MALALTIGATTQTSFIKHESMSLKFNTFDFALQNPSTVPAVGDAVSLTDTGLSWSGTVSSVQITDTVEKGTNKLVSVSATNSDEASASAATFGLSDTPNGSTTFGYAHLTTKSTLDRDGTTTTEGSLTTYHGGIWPAMTFELTSANRGYSAQDFTAQNVTVTWPKPSAPVYRIDFGDPIVTMSVWLNSSLSGTITTTKITDGSVTTPKLAAEAVTAEKVAAGAVTAESLEADLVLGSLIRTGTSGSRVELDAAGERVYNSAEDLLLNIPTDDSPIYVAAEIEASTLTVIGVAELQSSSNQLTKDATLTLKSGIQAPTVAPTLSQGYETKSYTGFGTPANQPQYRGHGYYDAAGGASGATPCFVQAGVYLSGGAYHISVYEWNWSTGVLDRETQITGQLYASYYVPSITRIGSNWYLVNSSLSSSDIDLWKVTRSTGAISVQADIDSDFFATQSTSTPISTNGTDIYVPGGSSSNNLRIVRYNTSLVKQATLELTEPSFTGTDLGWPAQFVIADIGSGNRHFIGLQHTDSGTITAHNVYQFDPTTGALISNGEWPYIALGTSNSSKHSLVYDGTNFWGMKSDTFFQTTVNKFTNWTWTTESAKYWVGYSWYDSNATGGTHETAVGPRASITMKKRSQLTVTTAAIPAGGGTDDPNEKRIYMNRGSSDPGAGNFKLQTGTTLTSKVLTTFSTGGAADGGGTAFPSSAGGTLQSNSGVWQFHGDGSLQLTKAIIRMERTTSAQTLTTGSATTVVMNLIRREDDDRSILSGNTSTGVITISEDGWYQLEAGVAWGSGSTGDRQLLISAGGNIVSGTRTPAAASVNRQHCSAVYYLTNGDTVLAQALHTQGANLDVNNSNHTFLSVQRIW